MTQEAMQTSFRTWLWKSCHHFPRMLLLTEVSPVSCGRVTPGHQSQDTRVLEATWRLAARCQPTSVPHLGWKLSCGLVSGTQ